MSDGVRYVVEYDENSVVWLVEVDRSDYRRALEHGDILTVSNIEDGEGR